MHADSGVEGHDFGRSRAMAHARLSLGVKDDGTKRSLAAELDSDPTGASLGSMTASEVGIGKDVQIAGPLAKAKAAFDVRQQAQ